MLKYQINIKDFINDTDNLNITKLKCYSNENDEVMEVACWYNTDPHMKVGDNIIVQVENTSSDLQSENYRHETQIQNFSKEENYFTFNVPQYISLNIRSIEEVKEKNIEENIYEFWWYFVFENRHYFKSEEISNISIKIEYYKSGAYKSLILSNEFQIIDDYIIKYNVSKNLYEFNEDDNKQNQIADLARTLFTNYNSTLSTTNKHKTSNGLADLTQIQRITRKNYLLSCDFENISIIKYQIKMGLKLPLIYSNRTDLLNQYAIDEKFFNVEREKIINKTVEMEKNIFMPIFRCKNDTKEIYQINFNLHLRHHSEDEEWKTVDNDYWNGVKIKEKKLIIDESYFSQPYLNSKKIEWQSDNLYRLGFTNNDVKYQKSRLKNTFLRLSWYDSDNILEQNLIGYSTVFLDSNRLFTCWTKNIKTEGYKLYIPQTNDTTQIALTGIGVQRELGINFQSVKTNEIENYRLSSQFSVQDRYSSNNCSDGFYIYLWKDYTQGTLPTDLYLHVDLNHARFGRSIPLMMPYFGPKNDTWDGDCNYTCDGDYNYTWVDDKKGVKSFYDIVNDWQLEHNGYNMQRYLRYSFIHFKGQFDKDNNRYVYYLDEEQYGSNITNLFDNETNTLNLVLYEAKISDGQQN